MRENFDCALLMSSGNQAWATHWEGIHAKGRLQIRRLENGIEQQSDDGPTCTLGRLSGILRAYDACLLPVSSANLAWARISLSRAKAELGTPIIVLAQDLQAVALCDLIRMGVTDFIRAPGCPEELRARLEKIRFDLRQQGAARRQQMYAQSGAGLQTSVLSEPASDADQSCVGIDLANHTEDAVLESCLQRKGITLQAFAAAAANRCASSQLSFKEAKNQVVSGFEQAYLSAMLGRCSGNIAQAARCSDKHRRAFWALVRKHDIDAAQFRETDHPFLRQGG